MDSTVVLKLGCHNFTLRRSAFTLGEEPPIEPLASRHSSYFESQGLRGLVHALRDGDLHLVRNVRNGEVNGELQRQQDVLEPHAQVELGVDSRPVSRTSAATNIRMYSTSLYDEK